MLAFVGMTIYVLYRAMKSKAVIINPDGTYTEILTRTDQTRLDRGKNEGVYNIRPSAFVKKMILGILPITRIYFMFGCPEPISFHSGKAVYNTEDLKLPVYGIFRCPKCKTEDMKVVSKVASPLLRDILFETRTKNLGKPEGTKFNMKWLVYIVIIVGVAAIAMAVLSSIGTGQQVVENMAPVVL
jgi:hypothetical protein